MSLIPGAGFWVAWDDDNGAITDAGPPIGLSANCDNSNQTDLDVATPYTVGMICDCGSAGWNLANDMRSLVFKTKAGSYQVQFGSVVGDNPIPKTSSFSMHFQFDLSWNWQ